VFFSVVLTDFLLSCAEQAREMLSPFKIGQPMEEEIEVENERRCEEERCRPIETQARKVYNSCLSFPIIWGVCV